jgi:hypothetical protein
VLVHLVDVSSESGRDPVEDFETKGLPVFAISGVTGEGLPELLEAMWREISRARAMAAIDLEPPAEDESIDLLTPSRLRRDA